MIFPLSSLSKMCSLNCEVFFSFLAHSPRRKTEEKKYLLILMLWNLTRLIKQTKDDSERGRRGGGVVVCVCWFFKLKVFPFLQLRQKKRKFLQKCFCRFLFEVKISNENQKPEPRPFRSRRCRLRKFKFILLKFSLSLIFITACNSPADHCPSRSASLPPAYSPWSLRLPPIPFDPEKHFPSVSRLV